MKLFELRKKQEDGGEKNFREIEEYIRPLLNQIDFNLEKDMYFEERHLFNVFNNLNPENKLLTQIYVANTIEDVGVRVRFNIPSEIVNITNEGNRILRTRDFLTSENIWCFLYIKTGWFVYLKFANVPLDFWHLTYRKDKKVLNRMYVLPTYISQGHLYYWKDLLKVLNHNLNANK